MLVRDCLLSMFQNIMITCHALSIIGKAHYLSVVCVCGGGGGLNPDLDLFFRQGQIGFLMHLDLYWKNLEMFTCEKCY